MEESAEFLVEDLPRARRVLRIAVIAESYPPDVGDEAATATRLVEGLRSREHDIQLVRPRRHRGDSAAGAERLQEILTRGMPVPRGLARLWSRSRPDVVYVLTQGPLGWSALSAARRLKLPVVSQFNTGFLGHCRRYGIAWLSRPIVAYLRKFHNRTLWTLVPNEALRAELAALGFRNLRVAASSADAARWWDVRRIETLLEVAASLSPYDASGERRTRTPMPQST